MLVDATDIDLWANTRDAEELLPQVVRRLVLAVADPVVELDFRAGEGIVYGGWDGLITAHSGTPHVPDGTSRWELTTVAPARTNEKANEDFAKRTADPLGANPSESTFVFVTAHRWPNRDAWREAKRGEARWQDVRAYDADNLHTWLEQAPAVHIWLSTILGRHPVDCTDLETHWENWANTTDPHMSVQLVVGGRREAASQVLNWTTEPPSVLTLKAETQDEALAFLGALLQDLDPIDRDRLLARCAIASSPEAWRELSFSTKPLLLIPQHATRQDAPSAVSRGHHVLVPFARNDPTDRTTLELPGVDRAIAHEALEGMGFNPDEAQDLAGLAWRGLAILRRRLAVSPALMTPPWADGGEARTLLPAILAGRWRESSDADKAVLGAIAGRSYEEFREDLLLSSQQPDAPVRRVGTEWHTVARRDSWSLLSKFLTEAELIRFNEAAVLVLREVDPKYDLPADQRYAAAIHDKVLSNSHDIRDGVSESVALLGAFDVDSAVVGADWANLIVREVLRDADWKLWASLTGQLPALAEASPGEFMDAVDRDLHGEHSVIWQLCQEEEGLFGGSPGTGLLFAIERLAWPAEYLARASMLLAGIDDATRGIP